VCEWRAFLFFFNVNFSVEFVLLGRFSKDIVRIAKDQKKKVRCIQLCRNEKRHGGTEFAKKEKKCHNLLNNVFIVLRFSTIHSIYKFLWGGGVVYFPEIDNWRVLVCVFVSLI